jgi:integrase
MVAMIRQAMPSITTRVAEGTKKSYRETAKTLETIFAEFAPHEVMPKHVAQLRRAYLDRPATGNHLLSLLRQIMAYGLEEELIDFNPCIGIKPLPSGKRDRLISGAEYDAIYAHASPRLQCVMDLARLTGQRVSDVIGIKRSQLIDEGISFTQQKTGARLIVAWSPDLRAVVERTKAAERHGVATLTLFSQRGGRPLKITTIRQQWDLACSKAGVENAQLRDLRAMAGTEAKRQGIDPTALLGHADPKMTKRYLRDREIPVVTANSFKKVGNGKA